VSCSRTENAYNKLISGEVDMIFALQPSDEQLQAAKNAGVELHLTPVAKDGFVFFLNSQNPVDGLSVRQIQDIYLKNITNWQDVGGNNREILPYQRQENSGSQTAMVKEVMKGEKLPPPLQEQIPRGRSMAGIVFEVALAQYQNKEEAIGYSFRFFTEEMMRDVFNERKNAAEYFQLLVDLISLYDADSNEKRKKYQSEIKSLRNPIKLLLVNGIAPSEDNIRNGTYPFTVDLFAVTAGTSNSHVEKLISWILSKEGQELVRQTGYVGINEAAFASVVKCER
jgi:phosphate transport system substrate-binding protein